MKYINLIALLIITTYAHASVVTSSSQSKMAVELSSAGTTSQAGEFKSMTDQLSSEDKKLLAKIIKKVIQKKSIDKETTRALESKNSDNLADAIMIITEINARVKDNNFEPLLDLYEIVKPGYSKKLKEELIVADKKLKTEDSPTHFIRHFARLDAYKILGVQKEGLTPQKVEAAFRKLSLELHPDKNLNNPASAQEAFNLLSRARDELIEKLKQSSTPNPAQ